MEVCGGQTHSIIRNGIDQLLPEQVELIHGPGCPVCVTPLETIDRALAIAATPGVIFCSFGDMLRVPGSGRDLFAVRAQGADVRIVYSPLDAVALAQAHPDREVVFFAIGFETTAPANAMAALEAERLGLTNFSMLVSHVLVPPAIEAILSSPSCRVQAFLAAGHVCTVMGTEQYVPLAREPASRSSSPASSRWTCSRGCGAPCASSRRGEAEVENAYARAVRDERQPAARSVLERGLPGDRSHLAGHRRHPCERVAPARALRRASTPSGASRSPPSGRRRHPAAAAGRSFRV